MRTTLPSRGEDTNGLYAESDSRRKSSFVAVGSGSATKQRQVDFG